MFFASKQNFYQISIVSILQAVYQLDNNTQAHNDIRFQPSVEKVFVYEML